MRIKRIHESGDNYYENEITLDVALDVALDEMADAYAPAYCARESIVSALTRGDEVVVNGVSYLGEDS